MDGESRAGEDAEAFPVNFDWTEMGWLPWKRWDDDCRDIDTGG